MNIGLNSLLFFIGFGVFALLLNIAIHTNWNGLFKKYINSLSNGWSKEDEEWLRKYINDIEKEKKINKLKNKKWLEPKHLI